MEFRNAFAEILKAITVVHRFSRKFQFDRKFEKIAATKCGSSALQKFDLVDYFDLIENFAKNRYSTVVNFVKNSIQIK